MKYITRHSKRDEELPKHRSKLQENAIRDLSNDSDVLGIYEGGSLAKGNFDHYSDIDLHVLVTAGTKQDFINNKRERSKKWGNVLFFEESSPTAPYIVTHYDCFVKIDSWYHSLEELASSIWLQGLQIHYDKDNLIKRVLDESSQLVYQPTRDQVELWRGKVFAFIHEIYRAVMRDEMYYAIANLDRLRWLIALGWYMEMERHLDSPSGVWSKIEGKRSHLEDWQLSLLNSWDCRRNTNDIMKTMVSMIPEFLRLNKYLCKQVGIDEDEEHCRRIMEMAF